MATEVLEQTDAADRLIRRAATVEEFWALPESLDKVEYVNGEIIVAPTPTVRHQGVVRNILIALHNYAQKNRLGSFYCSPLDVVLPSGDVVQPDVFFLTTEQVKHAEPDKRVYGTPPLVIEILSPGTATHDTLTKRGLYERNGVREYWIVDVGGKTIAQLVLRKKHYALTELAEGDSIKSAALAGFETNVGRLLGI